MGLPMYLMLAFLLAGALGTPAGQNKDLPCAGGKASSGPGFTRNLFPLNREKAEGSCDPNGVCYWSGEAPFCGGSCPADYEECGRSDCGEGGGILRSEWGLLLERRS